MLELILLLASTCPATLAERDGFTVCYDTQNRRPLWAAHTPETSDHPSKDHDLNSLPSAAFTNSGVDSGHLTPSTDTLLTSNAIAQDPVLNRGKWRKLENQIRAPKSVPGFFLTQSI